MAPVMKGDDKKLGMVASRKKKLERMGMEKNDKGHRFKLNRDRIGYYFDYRDDAVVDRGDGDVVIKLPRPAELRNKGPVLAIEGVSCGYSPRKDVLQGVTINVGQGERVALIGANGEGKSTLIKLIAGDITPRVGTVTVHREATVGFFMQHHVEQLMGAPPSEDVPPPPPAAATDRNADADAAALSTTASAASPDKRRPTAGASGSSGGAAGAGVGDGATALSYLQGVAPAGRREQELRNLLGSLGIKGGTATQPLATLSGGQAVRVALAGTVCRAPQLLILDEPSNHLDMDSGAALGEALRAYEGAVVLVSHDQFLVEQVADRVYLVADGTVRLLEGGMPEYVQMLTAKKKKKPAADAGKAKGGSSAAAGKGRGKR